MFIALVPAISFAASGTISATPNPCTVTVAGGTCTLTLTWSATGVTAAQVYVVDANNTDQQLFTTTSGSQSLNWIQALPQHYTFNLWNYSSGSRGALLASTSVSVPAPVPAAPSSIGPGSGSAPGPTVSGTTVTLQWNTPAGSPTGYGVYVSVAPYGQANLVVNDENVSGSATSYTVTLQANQQYRWNMRAKNATGWGSFSGDLYFQTQGTAAGGTISGKVINSTRNLVKNAGGTLPTTLLISM